MDDFLNQRKRGGWSQMSCFGGNAVKETTAFSNTAKATLIIEGKADVKLGPICHWGLRGAQKESLLLHSASSQALPLLCFAAPQ